MHVIRRRTEIPILAGLVERVRGWGAADDDAGGLVDALAAAVAAARRGEDGTVALAGLAPRLLGVPGRGTP